MPGTILVADANRELCGVFAKALGAEGHRVITAFDGQSALERIRTELPDLVLLEVILPGRDGFSVLESVRSLPGRAANVPVIFLSGCTPTPEYSRRVEQLGNARLLTKPVPLKRLVEVVGKALSATPTAPAGGILKGSLDDYAFPALLHHLHGLAADGVLALGSGRKRKWLRLRGGHPAAVRSNLVDECLGNYLEREGRISRAVMDESIRQMKAGRPQGEILVAMQVMSEEEVSEALRLHAEEKLLEVFAWPTGQFRFEQGAELEKASGLAHCSPGNLVLRGVFERMPIARVDAELRRHADARIVRGQEPFYRFQSIDLSPARREWVEKLSASERVGNFLQADEETRRLLYALSAIGILEFRSGPPTTVENSQRAHPAPLVVQRRPSAATENRLRLELTTLGERFASQNHFEILGVDKDSSDEEVAAAYEALAARMHPDRTSDASDAVRELALATFRHVEEAFEALRTRERRQAYALELLRANRLAAREEAELRKLEAERAHQRGELELKQRAFEAALASFGRALELNPNEGEYVALYGWALHLCHPDNAQMAHEALEHIRRGIKLAPEREKPYLLMGRLCKATGRPEVAEKMFARAVQIQPDCVEALREIRLINMRRGQQKGLIGRLIGR